MALIIENLNDILKMTESPDITAVQAVSLIAFGDENKINQAVINEYKGMGNHDKYSLRKEVWIDFFKWKEENPNVTHLDKRWGGEVHNLSENDMMYIIGRSGLSSADFKQDLLADHAKEETIKKKINDAQKRFLYKLCDEKTYAEKSVLYGCSLEVNIETSAAKEKEYGFVPIEFLRRDDIGFSLSSNSFKVLTEKDEHFNYGISKQDLDNITLKYHPDNGIIRKKWVDCWGNLKVKRDDFVRLWGDNLQNPEIDQTSSKADSIKSISTNKVGRKPEKTTAIKNSMLELLRNDQNVEDLLREKQENLANEHNCSRDTAQKARKLAIEEYKSKKIVGNSI